MTRVVVPRVSGAGSSQARPHQQQQQQGSISRPPSQQGQQQQQQQETQERETLSGEDNGQNVSSSGVSAGQSQQYCQFHTCSQLELQLQQQQQQHQGSNTGSTPSLAFSAYFDACDAFQEGENEEKRATAGGGGVIGGNLGLLDSGVVIGRSPSRDRRGGAEEVTTAVTTSGTMMMIGGHKRFAKESSGQISLNDSVGLRDNNDVAVAQPSDWLSIGHHPSHLHQHQQQQGESSADTLGGMATTTMTRQLDPLSRLQQTQLGFPSDQVERRVPTAEETAAGSSGFMSVGLMDDVAAAGSNQAAPPQAGAGVPTTDRGSGGGARHANGVGGATSTGGGGSGNLVLAGDTAGTPPATGGAGLGGGLLSTGGKSNGACGGGGGGGGGSRRFDGPSTSSIGRQLSGRRPLHSVHTTPRASARSSPAASRCSSPRGDGDGYNSADEYKCSWSSSGIGYGGPDYDEELERKFEAELKRSRNLEVRRIVPDGNCLFRAVADQVYGDQDMHNDARQMCIDYMEKERDHFSQFVTESFTAYCKRKRKDKVHGNNLEMQAMAEMYNRPIQVFSYSTEPINIFHGSYQTDLPPILLSYHRGNHYNSLYDPLNPTVGAGLGFGHLRGHRVDKQKVKAAIKAQQDEQIEKAMVAEGRFYSDLELTEKEIERAVMEASRAEYLAHHAHKGYRFMVPNDTSSSSSGGGMQASSSAPLLPPTSRGSSGEASERVTPRGGAGSGRPVGPGSGGSPVSASGPSSGSTAPTAADGGGGAEGGGGAGGEVTPNARMLMSMGFSYVRVMEAQAIFHDHLHNMLCFLLESESPYSEYDMYKRKGKAVERSG